MEMNELVKLYFGVRPKQNTNYECVIDPIAQEEKRWKKIEILFRKYGI